MAILQHTLFGCHTALGSGRVRFPAAGLNVDVHVELPAEHRHLRLGHSKARSGIGCQSLQRKEERGRDKLMQSIIKAIKAGRIVAVRREALSAPLTLLINFVRGQTQGPAVKSERIQPIPPQRCNG